MSKIRRVRPLRATAAPQEFASPPARARWRRVGRVLSRIFRSFEVGAQRPDRPTFLMVRSRTLKSHPPGAIVARLPNLASDVAERGWRPILLVNQSEHMAPPCHATASVASLSKSMLR